MGGGLGGPSRSAFPGHVWAGDPSLYARKGRNRHECIRQHVATGDNVQGEPCFCQLVPSPQTRCSSEVGPSCRCGSRVSVPEPECHRSHYRERQGGWAASTRHICRAAPSRIALPYAFVAIDAIAPSPHFACAAFGSDYDGTGYRNIFGESHITPDRPPMCPRCEMASHSR